MEIRLDGKAALVTGGSRGLGRAMAKRFAQSGADVAILARRADVLEETRAEIAAAAPGRKVLAIVCDVSKPDEVKRGFAEAEAGLGKIDILVNNAGRPTGNPFEEVTDEAWQADFDLKVFAHIRFARLALPGMKERRWGRILNIINTGAKAPNARTSPTTISRAASMALTKVLSKECAPHNVLVNALCTGLFNTDIILNRYNADSQNMTLEDYAAERGKHLPMGRLGDPEEYANVACFLVSDAASYVSGDAINIDGGNAAVV